MPGGDPDVLEQLASRLETAAAGAASLGADTHQVTSSIRSGADWTGDAADAYTAFSGNLGQGAASAEDPMSRIALAVREYAGNLRAAQQKVAAYNSAAETAQVSGNDAAYVSVAEATGQQAAAAVSDWQAAGDRTAAEVNAATGQLAEVFGRQGPVLSWLGRQPEPGDTLAGMPKPGDPVGPEILKTPPGDLGPFVSYSENENPNPELPPGYTSSPGLLGDPYNPAAVAQRNELWRQWVINTNARSARNAVRSRKGPGEIARIDPPRESVPGSQWHAQGPGEGSPGLNIDGTPHDGDPNWPERVLSWLRQYGRDV